MAFRVSDVQQEAFGAFLTSPTSETLSSRTDAAGGTIHYEYDLFGHLAKLTDQRGKVTTYDYDPQGRLIAETNPLDLSTTYSYLDQGGCLSCGGSVDP